MKRFALATLACISISMPSFGTTSKQNTVSAKHVTKELCLNTLEQHAFRLINKDRLKHNRKSLSLDNTLSKLARDYAGYLIVNDHSGHDQHDLQYRARQAGITFVVDENVLACPRLQKSDELFALDNLERSFMAEKSNGSRSKILAPDNSYVGIGIARSADKIILVQEFAQENGRAHLVSMKNATPGEIVCKDACGKTKKINMIAGYVPLLGNDQEDPENSDTILNQLQRYEFDLINKDRISNGAPEVRLNPTLNELARSYADYMMKGRFFGHMDPQGRTSMYRAGQAGIICGVYENLATAGRAGIQNDALVLDDIENHFMAESPSEVNHRYNTLLPSHMYVGIGIARSKNRLFVVEEFTDSEPLRTSEPELVSSEYEIPVNPIKDCPYFSAKEELSTH